jgi:3-oxoacyl-[acyl-carrier protein] reductase
MELKAATILITGGTLGIGYETARLLIESGARVAITGRHQGRVEKAAAELGALGIVADVARFEDVDRTYDRFLGEFGRLDCLINNAGIGRSRQLEELTPEDFQEVYAVNVFGAAMMASRAAALFREQQSGNIVNISSTAGTKGYPGGSIYASSKFALRGMTQCWQAELRPHNVRVFLINPSEVTTAFGNPERKERHDEPNKLRGQEIAQAIKGALEMENRGFIPELTVWATNPF